MSYLKTEKEIEIMREAGQISAIAMSEVQRNLKAGVTTLELDQIVEKVFKKHGADSAFKKVEDYQHSVCTTPNDWVVHGIPDNYKLKEGDIIGVDLGALYQGYNSDMAETFTIGEVSPETKKFLETGKLALNEAINQARLGNRVGDISNKIQTIVEGAGYSVVKELVGHGVGKTLHEDPLIPGRGKKDTGEKLQEGMVLAIEIIYNMGKPGIQLLADGWTIATKDGTLAGLFERTIAITKKGPVVLTAE
jgi:methionyl aminopeptidase